MFIEKLQTPLTVENAIIQLGDIDDSQKGRQFKSRFIQAGIAGYPKQFGNVLITKETLDKFVNTLVDKPVIINHKDEIKKEDEVGKVTKVWFNSEDGWFWCEGYLTDETAINLIKDKGWSVSCSYDVLLLDDEGGTENNIKYDKEFLNGRFTHLAIVENPRYERANIVVNSKTEIINNEDDDYEDIRRIHNDRWITVHPNGEDEKGRHLLIQDGEDLKEAMQRQWGVYDKRQAKLKSDIKKTTEKTKSGEEKEYEYVDEVPEGYKKLEGATTAPRGYTWYTNGKSMFGGERHSVLVKDKSEAEPKQDEKKQKDPEILKYQEKWENIYKDDFYDIDTLKEEKAELIQKAGSWDNEQVGKLNAVSKAIKEKGDKSDTKNKQSDSKGEKQESSIEQFLTYKSDVGQLYQSKGTSTYTNGTKTAEVEETSDGAFRVVYRNNGRIKDVKGYATKSGMEKGVKKHLVDDTAAEAKPFEKSNLEEKENTYKEVLKRYEENHRKMWFDGISNAEYYKAAAEAEKAKKELTTARREYAESIMANFEQPEDNPYQDKIDAKRGYYQEKSDDLQKSSERNWQLHEQTRLPLGQPIINPATARAYKRTNGYFDKSLADYNKSKYYAEKANSYGSHGISADDANAIAKLAQKYKSGVTSAEKRRIIDRVIDIHSNRQAASDTSKQTDYSNLGFQVERNADMNRLQLKFNGKPDEKTRSILKSNGFRWSPTQGAWQRQLNGNSEYGLKRVVEGLKKVDNSLTKGIKKIFNSYVPTAEDIPLLQGLIDIFEKNNK